MTTPQDIATLLEQLLQPHPYTLTRANTELILETHGSPEAYLIEVRPIRTTHPTGHNPHRTP